MESWREQYLGVETIPASLTLAEIGSFLNRRSGPGRLSKADADH